MTIQKLDDLVEKNRLTKEIAERIEKRLSNDGKIKYELTDLQKKAFSSDYLWCDDEKQSNIIIQGATSSGKTLVTEVMMANYLEWAGARNHVICLVPLKAMVTEKIRHITEDLGENRNIVGSSSDYQENDEDILNGNFEVAVIVYEKFFAMLAQSSDLLTHCGILIVDELQMLSVLDRGPKLEFAIMKIKESTPDIRIVGLTTVDCKTEYVQQWLNVSEKYLIHSAERPVGLEECIIDTEGNYKKHTQIGEREKNSDEDEKLLPDNLVEGKLQLKNNLRNGAKIEDRKRNLLLGILKDIYDYRPSSKVVVFVNGRVKSVKIAEHICKSGLFQRDDDFTNRMEGSSGFQDTDEYIDILKKEYLPYGVAFHNSSLSIQTREIIERNFENMENGIQVIVATETLMVGINMPVDVVILYDIKVHRQGRRTVALTEQEYKNYIGRAGRLGYYEGERQLRGKSFLFAEDNKMLNTLSNKYIFPKTVNIKSSLINANEITVAPYYLNLLAKGKSLDEELLNPREDGSFCEDDIKKLQENSFSSVMQEKRDDGYTKNILKYLCNANLVREDKGPKAALLGKPYYELSDLGKQLAPYALNLLTCMGIEKFFVQEGGEVTDGKKEGGLPYETTAQDIMEDKYLLDILYSLCDSLEVEVNPCIKLPEIDGTVNPAIQETYYKGITEIKKYLLKHKEDFWKGSMLGGFLGEEEMPKKKWDAVLRAILLSHWVKGETAKEIKASTGIESVAIITGDLARIAEVCSYQMEAAQKCLGIKKDMSRLDSIGDGGMIHAFYILSKRVKYGMKRELIVIANKHIFGVSRNAILQLGKAAEEYYGDDEQGNVILFIKEEPGEAEKYLLPIQRRRLLEQIDSRNYKVSFEQLITNLLNEDDLISTELWSALNRLATAQMSEGLGENLRKIFNMNQGIEPSICSGQDNNQFVLSLEGEQKFLIAFHNVEYNDLDGRLKEGDFVQYREFFDRDNSCYKKMIVTNTSLQDNYVNDEILCISQKGFAALIALCIAEINSLKCGELLRDVLWDLQGSIHDSRNRFWQGIIKNYRNEEDQRSEDSKIDVVLLYDKAEREIDVETLHDEIRKLGLTSRDFIWGDNCNNSISPETIVICWVGSRVILQSRSVCEYIQHYAKYCPGNLLLIDNGYGDNVEALKQKFGIDQGIIRNSDVKEIMDALRMHLAKDEEYQYLVGLSFPEEERQKKYFAEIAEKLRERYGKNKILYCHYHEDEFYRVGASSFIKELYEKHCLLDVVCDCSSYDTHRWCKYEAEGIHTVMESNKDRVLFVHVGEGHCQMCNVENDMYIDGEKVDVGYTVNQIISRLKKLEEVVHEG